MTNALTPTHAAMANLEYADGILVWGGRKVTDIVAETGGTPLYIYDSKLMSQRVDELRYALPDTLQIHYAMKANPLPAVVNHMAGLVNGLDIASANELEIALQTGTSPEDISFAGPGKSNAELRAAITAGITINIESEGELRRVAQVSEKLGKHAKVAVRVNPPFELKTAGMKMGGRPSQFGVDAERVPDMLREIESLELGFCGLHVFSGSQNLRSEAIIESLEKTVELVVAIAGTTSLPFSTINLGGGIGIPYFPNEAPVALSTLTDAFGAAVDRLVAELGKPALVIELGRYLVGEAGIYVWQSARYQGLPRQPFRGLRRRVTPSPCSIRELWPSTAKKLSAG